MNQTGHKRTRERWTSRSPRRVARPRSPRGNPHRQGNGGNREAGGQVAAEPCGIIVHEGVKAWCDSRKEGTDGSWFLLCSVQNGLLIYLMAHPVLNLVSPANSQTWRRKSRLQDGRLVFKDCIPIPLLSSHLEFIFCRLLLCPFPYREGESDIISSRDGYNQPFFDEQVRGSAGLCKHVRGLLVQLFSVPGLVGRWRRQSADVPPIRPSWGDFILVDPAFTGIICQFVCGGNGHVVSNRLSFDIECRNTPGKTRELLTWLGKSLRPVAMIFSPASLASQSQISEVGFAHTNTMACSAIANTHWALMIFPPEKAIHTSRHLSASGIPPSTPSALVCRHTFHLSAYSVRPASMCGSTPSRIP